MAGEGGAHAELHIYHRGLILSSRLCLLLAHRPGGGAAETGPGAVALPVDARPSRSPTTQQPRTLQMLPLLFPQRLQVLGKAPSF